MTEKKVNKTKTMKTIIGAILDRSGSMYGLIEDGRGGFNQFVKDQIKAEGDAFLYLTIFDSTYEIIHDMVNINDVPELGADVYFARGSTSLLDATGKTINIIKSAIEKMDEKPDNVIIIILTDGQENSSTEYTRSAIKKMIEITTEEGWEYIYMGANQDSFSEARNYGIAARGTMNYSATKDSLVGSYGIMSANVTGMRSGLENVMPDNDVDVDEV